MAKVISFAGGEMRQLQGPELLHFLNRYPTRRELAGPMGGPSRPIPRPHPIPADRRDDDR